jgi:DNA-binding MarR family transcriptional regulator
MPDDLFLPEHCVGNNLNKTARAVSRVYAEELAAAGLARSQFSILSAVAQSGGASVSALAEMLYMDRTTLTRNLRPLEKAGLVRRDSSAEDARAKRISLTEAGIAKVREARVCWRRAQQRMLKLYGETRWQALETQLRDLRRLTRNMQ